MLEECCYLGLNLYHLCSSTILYIYSTCLREVLGVLGGVIMQILCLETSCVLHRLNQGKACLQSSVYPKVTSFYIVVCEPKLRRLARYTPVYMIEFFLFIFMDAEWI